MCVSDTILSIILTSHNQLGALKFSLLSILDQQPDVPFEIIVVDCGSTDGSDQFLTGQAEKGSIRAIFAAENKGRTPARNQGAHAAFGRHLMFLDPGVLVGPFWSESLVRSLEKDPGLAAVAGRVLLPDGTLDHAGLALLQWPATETSRPRLSSRAIHAGRPGNFEAAQQPMKVQALAGEAIMVRATSFFAVGGFSARVGREHQIFRPDFEGDPAGMDICLRLGHRGWSCVYRPESIVSRLRDGGGDFANHERDMGIINRTWLDRVHPDFRIAAGGGGTPCENGSIRPYVEPVLNFQSTSARGMVSPERAATKTAASVIIHTHDDLEMTRRCVTALLDNTESCHELLVLDSGTDLAMNEYLGNVARKYDQFQLVIGGDDSSEAEAMNKALNLSEGRHIVLLDRRVVVTPGWLETLIGTADMSPRAGMVGPVTNRMNGMQQVPAVDYDIGTLEGLDAFATRQMMQHSSDQTRTMRLGGFCLLIKRELLARIGGLDIRFDGGFYEFNDYSMRAHMAGYECLIARGCYVHHQPVGTAVVVEADRMMQLEIQWEIFKRKWNIPEAIGLNSTFDISTLMVGGFNAQRHFISLGVPTETARTAGPIHQGAAQS
jgi:GT2 family glycosyltransferase